MTKLAIYQKAPVFLDRAGCLRAAADAVAETSAAGARVVIFPEAFIPGYPAWIWRMRPGGDMRLADELNRELLENAVDLSSDHLRRLQEAARRHRTTVVCGMHEREGTGSRGTLFNSVVTIGPDGVIRNRHRKVMPTNPERMVWGQGDAMGIRTVDSECGRLGSLICWESYMPLARYALYSQGIDLYIAPTYDSGDRWISSARHIAKEAGCWVASSGVAIRGRDIRGAAPGLAVLYPDPDEWVNAGDSVVVSPSGAVVAGPLHQEQDILYADIDLAQINTARRTLDVVGHYARPDLFTLQVRASPLASVKFDAKEVAA